MKSDKPYLGHILDSIEAISTYVADGREAFMQDRMMRDAVVRNFEIIGEAAARLSPDVRASAEVPWRQIIAFRNRLIHGYWSVDPLLVWDVVANELPVLRDEVVRLLTDN